MYRVAFQDGKHLFFFSFTFRQHRFHYCKQKGKGESSEKNISVTVMSEKLKLFHRSIYPVFFPKVQ